MSEEQGLTPYETREILFYKTENGEVRVEILLFQENLWLTQAKMAELFEVQKAAISKHLKNIFESGELSEDSVVSKMETTAADGKRYQTNYYNLDAIIAVGYRVNSKKATMFRIWANRVLKEFIIKGYVMDDARLREPENFFGKDYFEEQLERIRDIRASERRFYQKITDIYSQCSADYDVESPITKEFFATVQNKLHYAVTHHTAAEIVYGRADSTKPNMGLTTWKNAPKGRIRKSDVTVAKNYLNETEMRNLNEIVTMYLDYAERQARRGNVMYIARQTPFAGKGQRSRSKGRPAPQALPTSHGISVAQQVQICFLVGVGPGVTKHGVQHHFVGAALYCQIAGIPLQQGYILFYSLAIGVPLFVGAGGGSIRNACLLQKRPQALGEFLRPDDGAARLFSGKTHFADLVIGKTKGVQLFQSAQQHIPSPGSEHEPTKLINREVLIGCLQRGIPVVKLPHPAADQDRITAAPVP